MAKTQNQTQTLWKVECDPLCGFLVRDHDQQELTGFLISHCKTTHNQALSARDAAGYVKPA